ncbi:MAG: NAD(P)/FAD-dependent oxidoreductase [Novosphingobium sp.]
MNCAEVLVIGGGIAGMSAAAALAGHARVVVLEAEQAVGYHSSGRSATYYHFGIGNRAVRAMTAFSREFFEQPPVDFADQPFCRPTPALFVARPSMVEALAALEAEMQLFTDTIERIDEKGMLAMVPVLKTGGDDIVKGVVDYGGRRLDADRLLQAYARRVKYGKGDTVIGARVAGIDYKAGLWQVTTERGQQFAAPVLINAAGAWADHVAGLAGVRPLGLEPKRRTVIMFDPPNGIDASEWPFVKAAVDDFYMIPESGRILASPVDEVDSPPTDAQPEEYDLALAAWKVEEYTTMTVPRIQHRWAGLRSFVPDRVPTAGFAPDADGFFWLAGQGGYGLQTAPAMAAIVSALVTGGSWPEGLAAFGLTPDQVLPDRLVGREVSV